MDGLFTLVSLSVVMAVASFLAGILPLSLSLNSSQLRLVSTIGMGVLVGTSLIVIIPEGVETLYSAQSISHASSTRHLQSRSLDVRWPLKEALAHVETGGPDVDAFLRAGGIVADKELPPPPTPTKAGTVGIMGGEPEDQTDHGHEEHHEESHHAWMGLALISGFILMFLIDKLPHYIASSKPNSQPYHISLTDLGRRFNRGAPIESESETFLEGQGEGQAQSRSYATTTGLVIHAAADGIALGASSAASNTNLSFIIFFAIMVHKAPAAFGLTSVLLKQGISKRSARSHLLLFSLAAPAGALLTWMFAHAMGAGRVANAENTKWWTGMLLLFSGGTFLYVAMHTMQENTPSHETHANIHANGSIDGREAPKSANAGSLRDLFAAVFGMILPLFLQIGHAH